MHDVCVGAEVCVSMTARKSRRDLMSVDLFGALVLRLYKDDAARIYKEGLAAAIYGLDLVIQDIQEFSCTENTEFT